MSKECYVAELKYTDGNRVEMGEAPSYVIVEKANEDLGDGAIYTRFVNLFTGEEYPTFSRSKTIGLYRYDDNPDDMTDDGSSMYGCGLIQESTDMKEGPCYILTGEKMENISRKDIENMIIYSNRYFKDRTRIMNRRGMRDLASRRIIFEDKNDYDKMVGYFNEHDCYDFNILTTKNNNIIRFRR